MGTGGDAEIAAEAEYLAAARAALHRMRADVLETGTPEFVSGTDEVWFNTMYRLARARRGEDLIELPDVPLFFGRLDYAAERVYVGRRHVRDEAGTRPHGRSAGLILTEFRGWSVTFGQWAR